MIWFLPMPIVVGLTFYDLWASGFPELSNHEPRWFLSWCFLIFAGTVISGMLCLILFGGACLIGGNWKRKGVFHKTYLLVALREKDGRAGTFFLGSGTINSVEYYFWYRRDGDHVSGGKTLRQSGVRIYEDGQPPSMVTYKTEYTSAWVKMNGWLIGFDPRDDLDWPPDFHIPQGSVKEGFSL